LMTDPRRFIPRVDEILQSQAVNDAREIFAEHVIRTRINQVLGAARAGLISPQAVMAEVEAALVDASPHSLHPILNATGVIIHTNVGRAPLPQEAVDALVAAAGYTDVELDLETGLRSKNRGRAAIEALLAACPDAEDALVVNNGAAALLLATAALAPEKEVIISRGELVEIGAGFRLPELIESTSVRLKEIGATNRTHLADYEDAVSEKTGAILKVHPSNFRIEGFTASVGIQPLRQLADRAEISLIVDLGSGLLRPDATVPEEPDVQAQLAAGADIVIASGDKLLGGPQAGIMLGKKEAIAKVRKHPLARAVRIDKLRLNALEASVNAPSNAVEDALHLDAAVHLARTEALAQAVGGSVIDHAGRVGGGGAPEYTLSGYAVALNDGLAPLLRQGKPAVLPRVHNGHCLIDVRCIPAHEDEKLISAILRAQEQAL